VSPLCVVVLRVDLQRTSRERGLLKTSTYNCRNFNFDNSTELRTRRRGSSNRAYVRHIEFIAAENASKSSLEELRNWVTWALSVAQDLDQTKARVAKR
jgi:hypothetical protein